MTIYLYTFKGQSHCQRQSIECIMNQRRGNQFVLRSTKQHLSSPLAIET